jgi:cytochrome P450 family 313
LDATAQTSQSTLFFLALNPIWQERVYDEMKEVFGNAGGVDVNTLNVTHEQIARLKCLDWCWKESMRLHTPAPIIGRNLSEDFVLGKSKLGYHHQTN